MHIVRWPNSERREILLANQDELDAWIDRHARQDSELIPSWWIEEIQDLEYA